MAQRKYNISKAQRKELSSLTRREKKGKRNGNLKVVRDENSNLEPTAKIVQFIQRPEVVKRPIVGVSNFNQFTHHWPIGNGYRTCGQRDGMDKW